MTRIVYDGQEREIARPVRYVQSFIQNISFPTSLDELYEFSGMFNMEQILGVVQYSDLGDDPFCFNGGWTAPKWAKAGDIVFFFHAKTANARISKLVTSLEAHRHDYDEDVYWHMMNGLTRSKAIWDAYGGKVFAVGRVSDSPYLDNTLDDNLHFGSRIFAPIDSIFVLSRPIDISEFNDRIMISRQGSITPLFGDSFEYLKSLVMSNNRHVMDYLVESVSQELPLSRVTRYNWFRIANEHRRSFLLEAQFRAYYVDYMLRSLSDGHRLYSECCCQRAGCNPTWVDNVIVVNGRYLPVEVKLDASLVPNMEGQLAQYHLPDSVDVSKRRSVGPSEMWPYVMLVDTNEASIYDGSCTKSLMSLDDISSEHDVLHLREMLENL